MTRTSVGSIDRPIDPKKFNTENPTAKEWTDEAFRLLELGEAKGGLDASVTTKEGVEQSLVSGVCPYCGDRLRDVQVRDAVTEGSGGASVQSMGDEYRTIVVTCGCQVAHPGDPSKGTGCGTTFKIEVLPS